MTNLQKINNTFFKNKGSLFSRKLSLKGFQNSKLGESQEYAFADNTLEKRK